MKEFFSDHFDKLLLTALFLVLMGIILHVSHDGRDAMDVGWAREQANLITGALLGLITGQALGRKD